MNFKEILDLSWQRETERLHRPLLTLMPDEYRLDNTLRQQVLAGNYQFPDALTTSTDKRSLIRTQAEFSAKVHIQSTPLYFHRHEFVELLYMYQGECKQYIENLSTCLTLKEGDIFLLNPSVTHGLLQEDDSSVMIKVIIPTVMPDHEFIRRLRGQQAVFWADTFSPRQEYYHYIHYAGCTADEQLFIERMMTEYYSQNECREDVCRCWLQLLLIALEHRKGQYHRHKLIHSAVDMGHITRYNYEHSESVTLDELAKTFSYSPSYLSRAIKERCGMTFLDLLRECRLEKAAVLLTESGLSVEGIAIKVGYKNAMSVYDGIKRKFGLSPREYREKYCQVNGHYRTNE